MKNEEIIKKAMNGEFTLDLLEGSNLIIRNTWKNYYKVKGDFSFSSYICYILKGEYRKVGLYHLIKEQVEAYEASKHNLPCPSCKTPEYKTKDGKTLGGEKKYVGKWLGDRYYCWKCNSFYK